MTVFVSVAVIPSESVTVIDIEYVPAEVEADIETTPVAESMVIPEMDGEME